MFATAITILAAFLFAGLLVSLLVISIHNRLVRLRNHWEAAFAQLQVPMRRRYDLIAQWIDVAKKSPHLNPQTLTDVADACQTAVNAEQAMAHDPRDRHAMVQLIGAELVLDAVLGRLENLVAAHPTLSDDKQVVVWQQELESTNSRIDFAREAYDDFAAHYHAGRQQFPARWVANRLGFGEIELFQNKGQPPPQDDEKP